MVAMRGTAAMPVLYNKIVDVGGVKCVDGGIADPVPIRRAIDLGCTDIVTILTRPTSFRSHGPSWLLRLIERPSLRKLGAATRELIFSPNEKFNDSMDILNGMDIPDIDRDAVRISVIAPSNADTMANRTTRDREVLRKCALMARQDVAAFLDTDLPRSEKLEQP